MNPRKQKTAILTRSTDFDFAVVGGGVVGLSIAHGLLQMGNRVAILDEDDIANRASRGNFALVWLQSKGFGMPAYSQLTQRSIALWPEFAKQLEDETGIDVALAQNGGFLLFLDEGALENHVSRLESLSEKLGDSQYPTTKMDNDELRKMLPAIGPDVVGGTYCPLDGHVNALRLFHALHRACISKGVTYVANAGVTNLVSTDGGYALRTGNGEFRAGKVVLAAGLGNIDLAPMVGMSAPLRPERGQLIVTEKLDHFLDYPTGTIRQTDEGGVMIGASKEDAGFDTGTSSNVLAGLASDAVRTFSVLARARVVRSWSALRVMSPDEFPIYDENLRGPGASLVTCHSGVTLAAGHALELARDIAQGKVSKNYQMFSPKRFENVQTVA